MLAPGGPLGRGGIPLALHKDVEHNTVLVHRPSDIMCVVRHAV
jgi:hypothetical protein